MMGRLQSYYDAAAPYFDASRLSGALLLLVLFAVAGGILSSLLRRAVRLMIAHDRDGRLDRLGAAFVSQFGQVFIWVFVAMLYAHTVPALDRLGTALLASVSIASVVVGLAAQSTLANLIAGLSLVLYKPFRLGDRLEVAVPGGAGVETGTVEAVSLGYTVILTFDNRRVVLSNSTIANTVMINHTKTSPRVMAVVPFSIGYDADIDAAREIVLGLAQANPDIEEVVSCPVVALNTSSVDLNLMGWCRDAATATFAKYDLFEAIKKAFDASGIEIPYPHQSIVLKRSEKTQESDG